jgi:hypothetical protein
LLHLADPAIHVGLHSAALLGAEEEDRRGGVFRIAGNLCQREIRDAHRG